LAIPDGRATSREANLSISDLEAKYFTLERCSSSCRGVGGVELDPLVGQDLLWAPIDSGAWSTATDRRTHLRKYFHNNSEKNFKNHTIGELLADKRPANSSSLATHTIFFQLDCNRTPAFNIEATFFSSFEPILTN